MKFSKSGKTALMVALSSAMILSFSSCVRSFTVGYLYVTGTVTATPSGNGIITGFKIDNNTGKLKAIHGLPIASGGANPVRAVLITGSRFLYVLNRGTNADGTDCTPTDPCTTANITQFVVGGNGILTPQETFYTQGLNPFRLIADSSGNYLMALDHDAPSGDYCGTVVTGAATCGDITVFSINSTTGRLSLVVNSQLTTSTGSNVAYFPVPANPIDFALVSASYVMTLSGTAGVPGQTVYPYTYNSNSGQLGVSQSIPQVINNGSGGQMADGTAIVYASGTVYVLDNEPLTATVNGTTIIGASQLIPFTVGTNGALQSVTGGPQPNDPTQASPIYLIAESKNKFLFVANQTGINTSGSAITGYTINTPPPISETPGSPWGTGSNPQCLVEDPSNQYIYTANQGDSTVTGKLLDPRSGELKQMNGSSGTFPLNGPASWCLVDGRTN